MSGSVVASRPHAGQKHGATPHTTYYAAEPNIVAISKGQPPNLDVRKNANPHATTKWSLGLI
ncbi:MAG: hypothetical protein QF535_11540 [Anaerolineales bacterium]|nr:hypothetical protein [Anaerolineales bacterium]